jgi:hypothetical protein
MGRVAKEVLAGSPEGAWASPRYAQPCLPDDAGDAGDEAAEELYIPPFSSVMMDDTSTRGRHSIFHIEDDVLC